MCILPKNSSLRAVFLEMRQIVDHLDNHRIAGRGVLCLNARRVMLTGRMLIVRVGARAIRVPLLCLLACQSPKIRAIRYVLGLGLMFGAI